MASTVSSRPIPALYAVYILRSTMRHASLYIGSTTDPPRRLKQHNGAIKGGAARTSRTSLRPWEMVGLVSGFPGAVAALKFEWALTNPHLSLHIPAESRLSVASQKKRNGHPKRPPASIHSILANLHLLLRVPSFARWPLRFHIFVPEVHAAYKKWSQTSASQQLGDDVREVEVLTDFPPAPESIYGGMTATTGDHDDDIEMSGPLWGIHALPLDYTPMRDYVDKARDIFAFEREGDCTVCHTELPAGKGLYAVCPNTECEAVGHLRCWSSHLLTGEKKTGTLGVGGSDDALVPVRGHCPDCGGPVVWGDMIKELTLRMRGPKEVEKLVKAKRRQEKAADKAAAEADKAAEKASKAAAATAAALAKLDDLSDSAEMTLSPRKKTTKKETTTKAKGKAKAVDKTAAAAATTMTKATKITKTTRVTKATASASTSKATKATTTKKGKTTAAAEAATAAISRASEDLLNRSESPEVIII
ncbi:Slx4p interacting protein [Sporothrix stenoceras]|uniref:Slx4p interacting protein n=1 Tax=Sporothrix stenoceras TaxID=5173 RepID=A0ABR3YQE6_9PEZI